MWVLMDGRHPGCSLSGDLVSGNGDRQGSGSRSGKLAAEGEHAWLVFGWRVVRLGATWKKVVGMGIGKLSYEMEKGKKV